MTKQMKVEFAPGCFDDFEGTQEELEALQAEIQDLFSKLTPEELEARSRPVNIDALLEDEDLTDDQFEQMLGALVGQPARTLQ